MIYQDREIQTKDGRTVILRNARPEDSEALIEYLKVTATETSFLVSEPEEITLTMEQEERFIRSKMESPDELMLIGTLNGKHVGNCAICSLGTKQRYRHRCSVAIALYQEYCGLGIGRQMLRAALDEAEKYGYSRPWTLWRGEDETEPCKADSHSGCHCVGHQESSDLQCKRGL